MWQGNSFAASHDAKSQKADSLSLILFMNLREWQFLIRFREIITINIMTIIVNIAIITYIIITCIKAMHAFMNCSNIHGYMWRAKDNLNI